MGLESGETDLLRTQCLCTRWESGETDLSRPRSGIVWVWRLGRQTETCVWLEIGDWTKQTSPRDQTCCARLENQTCVWFDSGETDLIHRPDVCEDILTETAEIDQDPHTETSGTSEKARTVPSSV